MSGIKVGDNVLIMTQHGKSEVCHSLEKGSIATVVKINANGVAVQGVSVVTGNYIHQFLGLDEVMRVATQDVVEELDECYHYFVDIHMSRGDKTVNGHIWDVGQECRNCGEQRDIVVHKLGWGYYDEEQVQCGR